MFNFDPQDLALALTLMWQGMAGIMIVMVLIAAIVWLFTKYTK